MVGEIYLRTHTDSNQNLIRILEKYGAEVVNASIAEWINYTTYDRIRQSRVKFMQDLRQLNFGKIKSSLMDVLKYTLELSYQKYRQEGAYERVKKKIHISGDHQIAHLDKILQKDNIYSFDVGTEACLSISGILQYINEGYNGVVNVYPFTCMPSTITSAVVKPILNQNRIPYLDAPYDDTFQPGRESAIRTFMYQADQHLRRNGRAKN
jgi:predicted nucleotide-binding protein (sugar kinase/HSP70/actin superfamily)